MVRLALALLCLLSISVPRATCCKLDDANLKLDEFQHQRRRPARSPVTAVGDPALAKRFLHMGDSGRSAPARHDGITLG